MDERLNKLRYDLGMEWGELAQALGISRAMLGFIRSGARKPSAALSLRIREMERSAADSCNQTATELQPHTDWRARALAAEDELRRYKAAFAKIAKSLKLASEAVNDLHEDK